MGLVRYAVPGLLLLYFLARSTRQRVFLLGIPFLMYMGNSVFFENAKIFWIPGRLAPSDHVMLWLVITWVVYFDLLLPSFQRSEERPRLFGPALSTPEEVVLVGIILLAALQLVLTAARYGEIGAALTQVKGIAYLFAGYFLIRGMLCRAGRRDTLDFIKALVLVNTLAALLFVLHQGLHLPVYLVTEYQTMTFMGQRITRSFYFMPQLLSLAIAYVFARRSWDVLWVGVVLVTLAALWVSYTRSLLVIAVAELVVVLGVRLLKARQAHLVVRRVATLAAVVLVLGVVAYTALPVQSQYFLSRIGMATSSGSVTGDPNLQNRLDKMKRVYAWIGAEGRYVGDGFTAPSQDAAVSSIQLMSSDLVWVPVLFRFGLTGVALVVLLYAAMSWRALRLSLSGDGDAEFLALVLLGVAVGTFLEGFVSWTFLNPVRYPLGLWVFAFVAAEACRRRGELAEAPEPEASRQVETAHA
ncbi:MAG TPA: hypothetical protein VIK03_08575 [Thermoleophilia bacterium]